MRTDRDQQSNKTADRAQSSMGGGNSGRNGSAGRPGGMGTQRSVFTSQDGLSKGISVAVGPGLANKNAQRAATYNAAAHEWNQSAGRPSVGNLINNMSPMGFAMEPPDIKRPQTFSGSTYHLGWNPGSLLGLAGMAAPIPGAGTLLGMAGQAGYTALGGKNPILSGPGSMGMPTWNAPGPGAPGASPSGQYSNTGGGANHLQNLASLNQPVSGNPGAPQAVGTPTAPAGPNYAQMMSSMHQITPNYGVSLPGYQYPKATV